MTSKEDFLTTVRAELQVQKRLETFRAVFGRNDRFAQRKSRTSKRSPAKDQNTLVAVFQENCNQLNCQMHRVTGIPAAAEVVEELICNKDVEFGQYKHVICHDHPLIDALKLWKRIEGDPITLHTSYPGVADLRDRTIRSFVGITVPELGVAESGTLLQLTRPQTPRSTSLVPSIHIALLPVERLVASLAEAYDFLAAQESLPDSFTFISGPSKTADIEAHLVHGAHGPCELHVIVIEEKRTTTEEDEI